MNTADSYEVLDVSDTSDAERLDSGSSDAEGLFSHIGHAIGGAVRGVGHAVGSAARTVGKGVKVAGKVLRDVAPVAQTVLSVIPGVGQGASAAIGAAVALSEGKPITDAVLAGVKGALPGGPVAQRAFDAATAIGSGLLKGQGIDHAALDAVRSQLPGGDVARVAFDTGLALAHGKSIQQAGLQGALHLLPDSPLARSAYSAGKKLVAAGHVDRALATAAQSAVGLPGVQTPRIRDLSGSSPLAVMRTLSPRVSTIAAALLRQPQLRGLPLAQLARTLDASEGHVRQAMSAIVATARRLGGVEQLNVPTLVRNVDLERMLGPDVSLDRALAQFGSRAAPNQSSPRPTRPRIRWDRLDGDEVRRILALLSRSRQREASGLDSTGTKWIVDPGDFAMKIAKKLTGSEGRYRELFAANPQKPLLPDGSNWVSLQPGEVLNLPASWIQAPPAPGPSPAPVTPVIPPLPVLPVAPPSPVPAPVTPPTPVTPPAPAPVFPQKPFGPPAPAPSPSPAPAPAPQQASTDSGGGSGILIPLAIGGVALFLLGKK